MPVHAPQLEHVLARVRDLVRDLTLPPARALGRCAAGLTEPLAERLCLGEFAAWLGAALRLPGLIARLNRTDRANLRVTRRGARLVVLGELDGRGVRFEGDPGVTFLVLRAYERVGPRMAWAVDRALESLAEEDLGSSVIWRGVTPPSPKRMATAADLAAAEPDGEPLEPMQTPCRPDRFGH